MAQLALQPSLLMLLPSSHSSSPSTMRFPQLSSRQPALQPSPPPRFPSSHSSPGSTMAFPHLSRKQVGLQPSPGLVLASSQTSPRSRKPSPQKGSASSGGTRPLSQDNKHKNRPRNESAFMLISPQKNTVI